MSILKTIIKKIVVKKNYSRVKINLNPNITIKNDSKKDLKIAKT